MSKQNNIVLTGFMGTGKSVVGKRLASRLGYRFVDTDEVIEKTERESIACIFATKGEPYFRALEKKAIVQVCQEKDIVIATGGGAIVDKANATQLKNFGTVICLMATPETILARIGGQNNRPLLQSDNPLERIRFLLSERADAYAKADVIIDTSYLSIDDAVEAILAVMQKE
ncbi:MAG: shikimate kinase [Candidatus Binatia bacterium]